MGVCHAADNAPTTAPYDLDDATTPLLPTGISDFDVWMFGKFAYTWMEKGVNTNLYRGRFELRLGRRVLRSDEAVIWITNSKWRDRPFTKLDVFLWQNAEIREPAGTVSSGPVFLVTVQTFGAVNLRADATSMDSQADTPLYKQAVETRRLIDAREAAEAEAHPAVAGTKPPPGHESDPVQVRATDPRAGLPKILKGPKQVTYRGKDLQVDTKKGIVTAIGDVYVTQSGEGPADLLEIKADAAVLFLGEGATGGGLETLVGEEGRSAKKRSATTDPIKLEDAGRDDGTPKPGPRPGRLPSDPLRQRAKEGSEELSEAEPKGTDQSVSDMVNGAYLEGDVVLSRGDRMIRASQIYYDFENSRALILDSVMRVAQPDRKVPVYVRAETVRQLSSTEYMATGAKVTSSEFYTPHYYIGADRVYVRDKTVRDSTGQIVGLTAGTYEMHNSTFNIGGVPVAYWPYTRGDFKQSEMTLRSLRTGYSSDFGATFETKWYLFNLLGVEPPKGYDAWLNLDYYSKRGPGVGINIDYERESYYGLFRSYYIYDHGEDDLGPFADNTPDTENRGRATWRHRQYLPKDWELTFEASYISDPGFLQEYEESEYFEGKEQETLVYLKKQKNHWAFTALAQWRVLDFLTQTEHLPDLAFHLIGQDIGGVATLFSESHAGIVRYLPDDRRVFDTNRYNDNTDRSPYTPRLDERAEIDLPLTLGPLKIVPFAMGRGNYWSSSPTYAEIDGIHGSVWRGFLNYGLRADTYFSRVYPDVQNRLFDISGIKHIIEPQVVAWMSHSNVSSMDMYPFDQGIETIDDFDGVSAKIRQRWQTKRGGAGQWRVVDLLTWDLGFGAFADGRKDQITHGNTILSRPEDSITSNYISTALNYRLSDTTAFLWDFTWDIDRDRVGKTDVSIAVERQPRLGYFLGWRYIDVTESNLFGGGMNYQINEKHTVAVRAYYDLVEGRMADWTATLVRKLPRWYVSLTFGYDGVDDDWSLTAAAWPEGLPEATLGSRRYTGLAQTTGIRPQRTHGALPAATPTPPVQAD